MVKKQRELGDQDEWHSHEWHHSPPFQWRDLGRIETWEALKGRPTPCTSRHNNSSSHRDETSVEKSQSKNIPAEQGYWFEDQIRVEAVAGEVVFKNQTSLLIRRSWVRLLISSNPVLKPGGSGHNYFSTRSSSSSSRFLQLRFTISNTLLNPSNPP